MEKLRPGVTERVANDPFRRRFFRGGGADIGVEIEPSDAPEADRQELEQSLGNETQLDVPLVSGELAADVGAVNLGLALYILLAAAAADGSHVLHPEVIRVSANGVNGLLEADFDFEAPAVEANDLQGSKVRSVHRRIKLPRVGWLTQTKRTNWPKGRHNRSWQ